MAINRKTLTVVRGQWLKTAKFVTQRSRPIEEILTNRFYTLMRIKTSRILIPENPVWWD